MIHPMQMNRLPRPLTILAFAALLLGGFGVSRSLGEQILPYLGTQESYVSARRHELELRNQLNSPEVASEVIQRAGDRLGERSWTRRFIHLPLGGVNLVLSALLFAGALRALARSAWGYGVWLFAAKVSIAYAVVSTVVSIVSAADAFEANAALATNLSLQLNVPAETLARWELLRDRIFSSVGGLLEAGYYIATLIYLRREPVRKLFEATRGEGV